MTFPIENLEFLDGEDLAKLKRAGILDLDSLLARAASDESRQALCAQSGVNRDELRRLARIADILRIQGVNEAQARLLDVAGAGSIAEICLCDAHTLLRQLRRKNVELLLVRSLPPESTLDRWINDAKRLPVALTS